MEVLKAQAVAARSYAIKRGSPICPSQACQVMKKEINSSAWQQAVDATRGWVLTGGSGSFQYSSTAGGYLNTSGWDTTSRTRSTWPAGSYESIAGSPWFYKGWYVDLAYVRGDFRRTCGRTHPWLTQKEFTDLLNAWVVYTKGTSTEKSRVSPVDTACWGGDPYSISEMKSRANQLGGSYNNVYAVAVSYSNGGFTSSVALSTDRGSFAIDGPTFKDIFNLRAPARISIRSPLFNIEKK
ncbi:MAG: hypothetical protein A2134_01290 [Candidatus Woykebacteria bacterium RBG_16_39_9b]|uniref:Sporulation stage II protein D amidase enhancer LytB N-terminal domain-containing protein n=1 Tax=Candidatus Woykebacteria bacterium RBG_16_39_9b TaxID=1802595 RepID=A0A1G1WBI8_9BACT|nr:MAG: hypothetical protein A2134_01290 [Candidatus Woykebacteria bacterium RBG_16_39_9b]